MDNGILINIKKLHTNVHNNKKSNIFALVTYGNLRLQLKNLRFKFSNKQYKNAKLKRENDNFTLNIYKRD